MGSIVHQVDAAEVNQLVWEILDEASQVLVRAESLVMLLRCADDVDEHHRFGAEIVSDLLKALGEKLADAQAQVRSPHLKRPPRRSR